MKKLFLFGNSHVCMFNGNDTFVPDGHSQTLSSSHFEYRLQRVGPSTAYNFFWNPKYYPLLIKILEDDPESKKGVIGLILGEIDCRWHIGFISEKNKISFEKCVEECVDRMFMCYIDLKMKGYNCIVFSVHPASTQGHQADPTGPFYGDYRNRNRITIYFNSCLRTKCEIHNIPFCDFFSDLINENLEPKMEYFLDSMHLKGSMVRAIVENKMLQLI